MQRNFFRTNPPYFFGYPVSHNQFKLFFYLCALSLLLLSILSFKHADPPASKADASPKREFRAARRRSERDYQTKNVNDISKYYHIDQKFFWYLVNKNKQHSKCSQPTIDEESREILYEPTAIQQSWYNYFKILHQSKDLSHYDTDHKSYIDKEIDKIISKETGQDVCIEFSVSEIKTKYQSMKKKKASGWDGIYTEHLMTFCTEF